jgi:hypothetical protein
MEKNPKNFAIWTALNSSPTFFTPSASFYGGADFSGANAQLRKAFCEKYHIKVEMIDIVYGTLALVDGQRIDYFAECSLDMNLFGMMQKFFDSPEL